MSTLFNEKKFENNILCQVSEGLKIIGGK